MSKLKRIAICLFIICIGTSNALCETTEQIKFSYISINEGLSQSTVFSIDQDNRGNMWFATYDGVNKYDGYAFTVYRHDELNPNTIANDISRIVKTDSQGRVWIGTREGLSYYDEKKDQFRNFFYKTKNKNLQVNGIAEISSDKLLISTPEGLTVFNVTEGSFNNDYLSTSMHKLIASSFCRQDDPIYIGTPEEGLYCYYISLNKLKKVSPILDTKQVQAILQQSPTRIWVATEGSGLFLINPKTKEIKNYLHSPANPKSISSNYIRSLALDSQDRLWIGTFTDLNIYHEGNDSFISYSSSPVESGSLSQRSVRSIFMDSQGGMWLGTYFGGLNYYHPIRNRIKTIRRIPYKNSLSDNVVSCIVEDQNKNLWIGTNDGGLNLYNRNTQLFTHYTLQEDEQERGIGSNNIKSVYVDEQKSLVYIGTHAGGLNVLHRNGGKMEHFNQKNSQLVDENVYAILPDGEGSVWLGTLSALVRFNPDKKSFTTIKKEKDGTPFPVKRITTLFRDSKKRLWIGGETGISVFTQHKDELQTLALFSESPITQAFTNCIYESSNGVFWFGTREGIYSFNEKDKQIKKYTTANGLPNNVIYGILEDSFGRLWLSTNRGIACFNPETEKFRNFTESDGLQSNQFTASYCRAASGQMYFGGIDGIATFRPELLLDNPYTPPVVYKRMPANVQNKWDSVYAQRIAEYRKGDLKGKALISWKYQQYMRDYLATVLAVDENIGRLMAYLEKMGELDNTIIVYTSDQRFFLGEHGWFDKRFMYEECQRMPLIIRFPKSIKAGSTSSAISMNVDFAPTFLDYAGITIPSDIQGASLKPILDNEGQSPTDWRKAAYYHYYEYPAEHSVKRHYGIRTQDFKLMHFYNDIDEWEMYDMKADPREMNNVFGKPEYAAQQKKLMQQLRDTQKQYNDTDPEEKVKVLFKGDRRSK